jgi:small-conductance mechanosensitive channel
MNSRFFAQQLQLFRPWAPPTLILLSLLLAGYLTNRFLLKRLKKWTDQTQNHFDDFLFGIINQHLRLWFLLGGVFLAAEAAPFAIGIESFIHKVVVIVFFISATLASSALVQGFVRVYAARVTDSAAATTLTENLAKLAVLGMGTLLLLSNLGISITPILTALGVGSLAVALALQDTLSNIFAGVHILASRLVEVGDYIKIDSGHEGYVEDVGWRATRIRDIPQNITIIPNSKLSQAVVTNYHQPTSEHLTYVEVGVSYKSDLFQVEQVTLDVARTVLRDVPGGIPTVEPVVRYHTLDDSAIRFSVILRTREFLDGKRLTHELIKQLNQRYKAEQIEFSFPQQIVRLERATLLKNG